MAVHRRTPFGRKAASPYAKVLADLVGDYPTLDSRHSPAQNTGSDRPERVARPNKPKDSGIWLSLVAVVLCALIAGFPQKIRRESTLHYAGRLECSGIVKALAYTSLSHFFLDRVPIVDATHHPQARFTVRIYANLFPRYFNSIKWLRDYLIGQ